MPSERVVSFIKQSLVEGELQQDFEYLLDTLTSYRAIFHPDQSRESVEEITGLIVCLVVKPKPPGYRSAMGEFRRLFRGIAEDKEKQLQFYNSIIPAALFISSSEDVVFRPSLYFSPLAVLGFETSLYMSPKDREGWFRENLPNWY